MSSFDQARRSISKYPGSSELGNIITSSDFERWHSRDACIELKYFEIQTWTKLKPEPQLYLCMIFILGCTQGFDIHLVMLYSQVFYLVDCSLIKIEKFYYKDL